MKTLFESRFGVTESLLGQALGELVGSGTSEADLYFEYTVSESLSLENGIVRSASHQTRQGMGARCVNDLETGYAFTESLDAEPLLSAARVARSVAERKSAADPVAVKRTGESKGHLYGALPLESFGTLESRVKILQEVDAAARAADPRVVQVMATLACTAKWIQIVDRNGQMLSDMQPMIRLVVNCIAQEGAKRETGAEGVGGRDGLTRVAGEGRHLALAREAARLAVENLSAADAPAGLMTVVLGPGSPGILLHEAIGHGLEADFNRKGTSAFAGRIGQVVASPLCTVIDDGTIPKARGSIHLDDEGTPSSRSILIEKGVLRGYLQDRQNARLLKMPVTGNARRESFEFAPMPRMTATFMLAGEESPTDIIRSVDRGIYFAKFSSGQVDITSGNFVFTSAQACLIEGGKLARPVKNATLTGNGPEILKRVSRVGSDLELDTGIGTCGKAGQMVPVNTGLPTIRVDGVTVGGTARS